MSLLLTSSQALLMLSEKTVRFSPITQVNQGGRCQSRSVECHIFIHLGREKKNPLLIPDSTAVETRHLSLLHFANNAPQCKVGFPTFFDLMNRCLHNTAHPADVCVISGGLWWSSLEDPRLVRPQRDSG